MRKTFGDNHKIHLERGRKITKNSKCEFVKIVSKRKYIHTSSQNVCAGAQSTDVQV